jgi:hypothetical protein
MAAAEAISPCAALSPGARLVLGCLEILADPSIEALAEVTRLTSTEVRRCLAELHAISQTGSDAPAGHEYGWVLRPERIRRALDRTVRREERRRVTGRSLRVASGPKLSVAVRTYKK